MKRVEFCNEGADVICITNEVAPDHDGWAMIAPFGDYPGMVTITNSDGTLKRFRALQRLDRRAADQMVANFKSLWGRVKRYVTGTPIYLGHPDAVGIGDRYRDKTPKGMFSDLEARDTGLWGKPVFTNEGLDLLQKFPALSGRWSAEEAGEETHNGVRMKIFRPDVLKSAGLTDKPNLPVELLNELETGQQQRKSTMNREKILALLKKHGVELNNDATDEQVEQALEKLGTDAARGTELANENTTLKGQVSERDTQITGLTGERDAARTESANDREARIDLVLDQALHEGRISPAEKGPWKTKLKADFANASQELAKKQPSMKTTPTTAGVGARKGELANVADRQAKVTELVNEAMSKNPRLSYDEAFSKVRRENAGLFEQMAQPKAAA